MDNKELEKEVKSIKNTFRLIKLWGSIILTQVSIIFTAIAIYAMITYLTMQSKFLNTCSNDIINHTTVGCTLNTIPAFPYWTAYMMLSVVGMLIGLIGIISNLKYE